ncbi:dihydrofolate reductase [Algoriphagus aestuariicola]|uniref:Dihydrofolate reductase n=1 Tax=Algoriphagus aestuariicola TaxID=1852016 RepID=A0ABS3BVN7_9BACT|nr:dihydrofolate reductase family protein [Algoriphagus aestuariicola]MBN7803349.1 dihydrofolate reductase [Algoriphagus aestuariicola]
MGKVKVMSYTISLDGFGAGSEQSLEKPMGLGAENLHDWLRQTKRFAQMIGQEGGSTGVDHDFAEKGFENLGAWIMGRNMFGPIRGDWPDGDWKGWWGPNPPYHVPVFVLTHHEREPLVMEGGTTFYFVTEGIESALTQAKEVANGKDIRIGGGAETIRQFLQGGHIDELHLAVSPLFLGSGEHLFAGIDLPALGYRQVQRVEGEHATHILITKG